MTSTTHRGSGFGAAWIRTFGTSPSLPKANRSLAISLAVITLLGTGAAAAAWRVSDRETQRILGNNGTVTGQLDDLNTDLNRKLEIARRAGSTPEMIAEPTDDEALDAMQPSATAVAIDKLCTAGSATMLSQNQQQLCEELANTELAQYRFSLRMFERASENYDRLKQLEDHRRGLTPEDYANLQYNTNEVLALTALMDNDRDRYRTYMAAYDARVAHIKNSQAALTRNALKGGGGGFSLPSL